MNRVPLSLGLLTLFAGLTLAYMALVGFGIVSGNTPAERYASVKGKVTGNA